MSIEAMKQAREELTRGLQFGSVTRATAILDKAIEQAEQAQPYGWKVYGVSGLFVGEYAEQDAKAEAKRIGGSCIAFPLYTAPVQTEQAQPVARVVSTAPKRIWLDLGFDPEFENEVSFGDLFDVTWSRDNATGNGIEYLRADLASPPRQPLSAEEIEQCCYEADSQAEDHPQTWKWTEAFARAIEAAHGIKENT